jgi:hypothetical protein
MASAADLARLRAIAPDPIIEEHYPTDELLTEFLEDQAGGDIRRAAGLLWEMRVAQTSHFVDIREGSSQRSMQQEFENAVALAARYLGDEFSSQPTARAHARTHPITRA